MFLVSSFHFQISASHINSASSSHILINIILNPVRYFHLLFIPVKVSSSKSTFSSVDGAWPSVFKSKNTKIYQNSSFLTLVHFRVCTYNFWTFKDDISFTFSFCPTNNFLSPHYTFLFYLKHHILVLVLFIEIFVPVEFSSSKSTFACADGASLSDFKSKNTKIN